MKIILVCFCGYFLTGCNNQNSILQTELHIEILDDEDLPVKGASVFLDNKSIGVSDSSGNVKTKLGGKEGRAITVKIKCPDNYKSLTFDKRSFYLKYLNEIGDNSNHFIPLNYRFICAPLSKKHVLIIRTDHREGLAINILGKTKTHTDAQGVAQLVLTGNQGDEVEVFINTEQHPNLRPSMPSRRLQLPDKSRFLVFDQKFEEKKEKKKKRNKKTNQNKGPVRL